VEVDYEGLSMTASLKRNSHLNFSPNKEHDLAIVLDDRVLTKGQAASRGLLLRHFQVLQTMSKKRTMSSRTFGSHRLSEYSAINHAVPTEASAPAAVTPHFVPNRTTHPSWQSTALLL
jgi:hypothetical protein